MTVNEYAAENHVSRQSVNSKINRHKDELKGHVFIINGRKMIDGFAQDLLKLTKDNALLIGAVGFDRFIYKKCSLPE